MADRLIHTLDTTLRDGAQALKRPLTLKEIITIAEALILLRVNIIEAGFPGSSPINFRGVREIAERTRRFAEQGEEVPVISGLARCTAADIDAVAKAIEPAPEGKRRIHVFIGTSETHREKLRRSRSEILADIRWAVERAAATGMQVQFSPEDAFRTFLTEPTYLYEAVATAIRAGATIINLPDTVGRARVHRYGLMFRDVLENVPEVQANGVWLSAHCHNDRGLAVANTLDAVDHGARQFEGTINGIGERAGNASIASVVANFHLDSEEEEDAPRSDIAYDRLVPTSRIVEQCTGSRSEDTHPVTGRAVFVHRSGIHAHGVLHDRKTYEIFRAADFGWQETTVSFNNQAGKAAVRARLAHLGFPVDDDELAKLMELFKEVADKKPIDDGDLLALLSVVREAPQGRIWKFERYVPLGVSDGVWRGKVILRTPEDVTVEYEGSGDGDLSAASSAILNGVGLTDLELEQYCVTSVGKGLAALAQADVQVTYNGNTYQGYAVDTGIVESSIQAFLSAVNHILLAQCSNGN